MKKITILVPVYNEEEVVEIFYKEIIKVINSIKNYRFEILFVNDGSKDNTLNLIKKMQKKDKIISYIDLSRNYGKEIAMAAGIDNVDADAMIIIDVDLQDPPELIVEMIKYFEEGYDDVYAKRKSREGESFFKKWTSKVFYKFLEKISKIPIQKDTGDFRLLSKKAISSLKQLRESQRYTKGLFSLIGFKKKEILFIRKPRAAGKTKWNYIQLTNLAVEGIRSFSIVPLKLTMFLGFFLFLVGIIYLMYVIVKALFFGIDQPGYASLMSVILFIGSLQFIFLGIIGEYVGRMFLETKKRPLYFINEISKQD